MSLKKEHKENRRKKEEEYHQMWIDFKPIYNTLESQTIFVKRLRTNTSQTGAAYSITQTPHLNLTYFAWVGLARLASTDLQIIFLYYFLG